MTGGIFTSDYALEMESFPSAGVGRAGRVLMWSREGGSRGVEILHGPAPRKGARRPGIYIQGA